METSIRIMRDDGGYTEYGISFVSNHPPKIIDETEAASEGTQAPADDDAAEEKAANE